jgi:hypothetical protein
MRGAPVVGEVILAVLPSFVSRLADEFLGRKRKNVEIAVLQAQVAQMAAQIAITQQATIIERATAERVVSVLTRYLTLSHGESFFIDGNKLAITRGIKPGHETLRRAIDDFGVAVQNKAATRPQPVAATPPQNAAESQTVRTLANLFDDVDEELLRMRLEGGR